MRKQKPKFKPLSLALSEHRFHVEVMVRLCALYDWKKAWVPIGDFYDAVGGIDALSPKQFQEFVYGLRLYNLVSAKFSRKLPGVISHVAPAKRPAIKAELRA